MTDIHRAVIEQLREHHVLALATVDRSAGGGPYVAPLYYALCLPSGARGRAAPVLVFASHPDSVHGGHLGRGPTPTAAAVFLETEELIQVRGLQLRGDTRALSSLPASVARQLRECYLERHPMAEVPLRTGEEELYAFLVRWAKITDNRLGLGVHPEGEFDAERTLGEL